MLHGAFDPARARGAGIPLCSREVSRGPLLVSTWSDGVFTIDDDGVHHERAGLGVCGLSAANDGSVLAIVDQHNVERRAQDGTWAHVARSESSLSCCVLVGDDVFVGTSHDAQLLRLEDGALRRVESFDRTPGRAAWVAGAALIDGRWVGPPLGIRSMSASADGAIVVANVHVGGIPRSLDRGASWHPTIEVGADVHQVVCHPSRPDIVAAAAAVGLCISRDGGATWCIEIEGLHAHYCSAAAFIGDDVLVAASADHFAAEGAVYRRPLDAGGALSRLEGGLPPWTSGIVDTDGIAVRGQSAAIVDGGGNVHFSDDAGRTWARLAQVPSGSSGVVIAAPRED